MNKVISREYVEKNYIPREVIEKLLIESELKYNEYKKGAKINANLKGGMWKHLGEVDILKKILGKQRNIVTLDGGNK